MRFSGSTVSTCAMVMVLAAGCGSNDYASRQSASAVSRNFDSIGAWTALPAPPLSARHEADGVWVGGRFVVFGGRSSPICPPAADCPDPDEPALRDGASFDPATGKWARIADAPVPVVGLNSVVAGDRLYLLTGEFGRSDSPLTFLSYAPEQDAWTTHPMPPVPGQLVAVGSSVVVVPGSDEDGPAADAIFDIKANTWQALPDDPLGPSSSRSAAWVDGALLLAAQDAEPSYGTRPSPVRLARLDDNFTRWSTLPESEIVFAEPPVTVGNRVVWPYLGSADGGEINNWGRSYAVGGIFDLAAEQWKALPALPSEATPACCSGAVIGDRVMVGSQLLDPATGHWIRIPPLPGKNRLAATVVGGPDAVLVWAGATTLPGRTGRPANLATGYLLRPRAAAPRSAWTGSAGTGAARKPLTKLSGGE
jgi:hypothetical protein